MCILILLFEAGGLGLDDNSINRAMGIIKMNDKKSFFLKLSLLSEYL
jgi:hypothetical protein